MFGKESEGPTQAPPPQPTFTMPPLMRITVNKGKTFNRYAEIEGVETVTVVSEEQTFDVHDVEITGHGSLLLYRYFSIDEKRVLRSLVKGLAHGNWSTIDQAFAEPEAPPSLLIH